MTPYQEFIHKSRYARWLPEKLRRESWPETVDRFMDYLRYSLKTHDNYAMSYPMHRWLRTAIEQRHVMPSMRGLMTAGLALDLENTAIFNCSYLPVDSLESFCEAMYILMCGTGVGYSVESRYVRNLPAINRSGWVTRFAKSIRNLFRVVSVDDSRKGWVDATRQVLQEAWNGDFPRVDVSRVRPAGARLKTFGGRASGPGPLLELVQHIRRLARAAQGRQITELEAHDLMCRIASVVIVGGVRRSAMISLSDLDSDDMALCKSGSWWESNANRAYANNSAVYDGKPSPEDFWREWLTIERSGSGERGIFNRAACRRLSERFGRTHDEYGTNPCSEIILRPYSFCNLSEVILRADDTPDAIAEKVIQATVLGTFQSTFTRFPNLRPIWQQNAEEERLLGVSMTGVFGSLLADPANQNKYLPYLRLTAREVNRQLAEDLRINPSAAITCVKPSGTVSQLCGVSSGLHPWHSEFYIRRVRNDAKDPITGFMQRAGVPCEKDVYAANQMVFSFPVAAPQGAITRDHLTAVEHLEHWKRFQLLWCEHKPSVTITVRPHEWPTVGEWVYENFDIMSGVSFLPYDGGTYQQAPYESITEQEFQSLSEKMPVLDWSTLVESEDDTVGSQEYACTAGGCEIK